jgi:prepilin-type processing-associated H-X9-DG protein/prepilin-type N-terminal cleavage/methylation domain-containing protein
MTTKTKFNLMFTFPNQLNRMRDGVLAQTETLQKVASRHVDAIQNDGLIHVYANGHSRVLVVDMITPESAYGSPTLQISADQSGFALSTKVLQEDRRQLQSRVGSLGFTLIETLVTVAIIAILAMLLFPAISSFRKRAETARCAGNLRAAAVMVQGFLADKGEYPYSYVDSRYPEYERLGYRLWTSDLYPYHTSPQSFVCPTFKRKHGCWDAGERWGLDTPEARTTYAMNFHLGGKRVGAISKPSATLLLAEMFTEYQLISVHFGGEFRGGSTDIHEGGSNFLFVDGHVEWRKKGDLSGIIFNEVTEGNPVYR